ncbi:bifunctional methylenetetrahydrofolate dehydrogenase/methenyltetrahydrofolate cyclohydrolase FolD [Novispirillum sp. DQ9]|uniref:bifunctional methylenetetrahydrofolate dehydrogenase/methenyltetrahydrofolate cyclohydrolase FolD n=1 Tax=Novispirillum sp. DQ9 TaxID=3398612 RepID=UPI003C7BD4EC
MSASNLIDGKAFADALVLEIAAEVRELRAAHRLQPGLAVLLVGADPASEVYVRNKVRQTEAAGLKSVERRLPATISEKELLLIIEGLNDDASIHGILVQLPLPKHIDSDKVIRAILPEKDVDGFHPINAGLLATSGKGLVPCTPLGCSLLLKDRLGDLSGLEAVVVGRSNIVGKPMAHLLLQENCTVTVAHSRTRDLPAVCRRADILIAAVGQPKMIKGDWIKPGATVIDVGINRIPKDDGKTRLVGDVDFEEAVKVAGAITPVPGGVGPMTIACLLRNTLTAAKRLHKLD